MTKVIMIRHAETEANLHKRWYGALDAPLTERGKAQVAATAARVAELQRIYPIDQFYVSPLGRAQATAAGIAAAIGIQPVIDEGLSEFDLGDWEGRTYEDLQNNEKLWDIWREDLNFAPPNAESPNSFTKRAMAAIERLVEAHRGEIILIVTHGGIIGNVLATWVGNGLHEWGRWEPHNCSISLIEKDENGWHVLFFNAVEHLPVELRVDEVPSYAE